MKPAEYFRELIEPTLAEFENDSTSVRRAFAASVFTYHFADAAAVYLSRKREHIEVDLERLTPAFGLIRAIANMSKHLVLDPKRNKGRPMPKIRDTHIGPAAAFTDGSYWSDGTSWTDSKDVVRIRDDSGKLVDIAWCLREGHRAIAAYLQRPDLQ